MPNDINQNANNKKFETKSVQKTESTELKQEINGVVGFKKKKVSVEYK